MLCFGLRWPLTRNPYLIGLYQQQFVGTFFIFTKSPKMDIPMNTYTHSHQGWLQLCVSRPRYLGTDPRQECFGVTGLQWCSVRPYTPSTSSPYFKPNLQKWPRWQRPVHYSLQVLLLWSMLHMQNLSSRFCPLRVGYIPPVWHRPAECPGKGCYIAPVETGYVPVHTSS